MMAPLGLALVLLADVGFPRSAHARPTECNVLPGERGANVWERAKVPQLRRYCDVLASASAKLAPGAHALTDAIRLAEEADRLVPDRAAPMLLKGRALSAAGQYPEALVALRAAEARDERALDEPLALLAFARALVATGDRAAARTAYHALLPRADALALADRGVAYLGAGMLALGDGPARVDDAVAILRQARRDSQDLLRSAATYALALALDRSGDGGQAAAVLVDEGVKDAARVVGDPRVLDAMGPSGAMEALAIRGLALEVDGKRDAARGAWASYLEAGGAGPWAAHARAHAGPPSAARRVAGHP